MFETKTRRQSNQVKVKTCIKEIFGIDLKTAKESKRKQKKKATEAAAAAGESASAVFSPPTPSPAKSDVSSIPSTSSPSKSSPTKSDRELEEELTGKKQKKTPKKAAASSAITTTSTPTTPSTPSAAANGKKSAAKAKKRLELEDESAKTPQKVSKENALSESAKADQKQSQQSQKQSQESQKQSQESQRQSQESQKESEEYLEEDYIPTEKDEEMQAYLQEFALELLETNPSWSARAVIQNLVIWEPVGPVIPMKKVYKKKAKKHKKRASGMDFCSSGKKKNKSSRDASRAGTPEREASNGENSGATVTYALDNVVAECKGWVLDKGAGETILLRAAKMGYPDVVAYALDHMRVSILHFVLCSC